MIVMPCWREKRKLKRKLPGKGCIVLLSNVTILPYIRNTKLDVGVPLLLLRCALPLSLNVPL